jgi:hypothetical protein
MQARVRSLGAGRQSVDLARGDVKMQDVAVGEVHNLGACRIEDGMRTQRVPGQRSTLQPLFVDQVVQSALSNLTGIAIKNPFAIGMP